VDLLIRSALPGDVEALHALRVAAADWLQSRGIQQWRRDDVPLDAIEEQVALGEWNVAVRDGAISGALRLLASDRVWPEDDVPAAYIHGFMIDRLHGGTGLGTTLLGWAADRAREAGARALRLDCMETNVRLRQYYISQGFTPVGRFVHRSPWHPVLLLERTLD